MKEPEFVRKLIDRINEIPGCYAVKINTGAFGHVGTPDIFASIGGRMLVIEAKIGRNQPTQAQLNQLARWRGAGALTLVLHDYNAHELEAVLQHELHLR